MKCESVHKEQIQIRMRKKRFNAKRGNHEKAPLCLAGTSMIVNDWLVRQSGRFQLPFTKIVCNGTGSCDDLSRINDAYFALWPKTIGVPARFNDRVRNLSEKVDDVTEKHMTFMYVRRAISASLGQLFSHRLSMYAYVCLFVFISSSSLPSFRFVCAHNRFNAN